MVHLLRTLKQCFSKVEFWRAGCSRLFRARHIIKDNLMVWEKPANVRNATKCFEQEKLLYIHEPSVHTSNFAYFSSQLFICQYHIWLAADTRGVLVLIPGNPMLNIIVSTFIFVCVAHEISQITNDLAQIFIPKDNSSLLKRLACIAAFFCGLLILSSIQDKSRH